MRRTTSSCKTRLCSPYWPSYARRQQAACHLLDGVILGLLPLRSTGTARGYGKSVRAFAYAGSTTVVVDDMGYGDVSCLTRALGSPRRTGDRLAREGMVCRDRARRHRPASSPAALALDAGHRGPVPRAADRRPAPHRSASCCGVTGHLRAIGIWASATAYLPAPHDRTAGSDSSFSGWLRLVLTQDLHGPSRGFDYYFGVDDALLWNAPPSAPPPSSISGDNLASLQGPAIRNFEQLLPTFARAADQPPGTLLPVPADDFGRLWTLIGRSGLNNLYADLVMETAALDWSGGVADNILRQLIQRYDIVQRPDWRRRGHRFRGYKRRLRTAASSLQRDAVRLKRSAGHLAWTPRCRSPPARSFACCACSRARRAIRDHVVHHSISGKFAIRDQRWKLVLCPGSGGWTLSDADAVRDGHPLIQLYDMCHNARRTR